MQNKAVNWAIKAKGNGIKHTLPGIVLDKRNHHFQQRLYCNINGFRCRPFLCFASREACRCAALCGLSQLMLPVKSLEPAETALVKQLPVTELEHDVCSDLGCFSEQGLSL